MSSVSVMLPTFNRLEQLKRVLGGLQHQIHPLTDFEVIVVSDGSSDGTNEYLAGLDTPLQLVPIYQTNQGAAAARNRGVKQACADLILFLDDDVVPAPQLISEHVRSHAAHGDRVVVIGPMLPPPDFALPPWVEWMHDRLGKQYNAMEAGIWAPTARQFYTGNASVARRHLVKNGGFDTSFLRAEDVELAYRLADYGLHFIFNAQAIGYHFERRSFSSWSDIPYAYGRNDVIITREKGQTWLLETVFNEYHGRHALVRGLTKLCLDRPKLSATVIATSRRIAERGQRLNLSIISHLACSCIFNLREYQGVSDELGGRERFFDGVANVR